MCYSFTKKMFQKMMPSRQEGVPVLKMFTLEDYPEMSGERFEFESDGNILRGYKYYVGNKEGKTCVILHHGMGAGHNAYETLIYNMAKHGYLVYAYDNACCGDSEGSGWWNFSSSLIDQKNFFKWFENDEDQKGQKRVIIGHSWGGFTALNGLRYPVDKVVAMSAFTNVVKVIDQFIPPLVLLNPLLKATQKHYFGEFGNVNCEKLLQSSTIPVLLIHGDLDDMVKYKKNFLPLKKKYENKTNLEFYTVKDRYHQPEMTVEAQNYYRYLESFMKKGNLDKFPEVDYKLLLDQDEEVLNKIFSFIDA